MPVIYFQEWLPDTPDLGTDSPKTSGCLPITEESYGPFASLATVTDALTARCQGAGAFLDSSGTAHIFAGDATKLYKLITTTWEDVSRTVGGAYAMADESTWLFRQHSVGTSNRIIALGDVNTDIQSYTLGSSTDFAILAAAAPRAAAGAIMYPGVLMVGNTWDSVGGYKENRVWWHDIVNNDPTNWPTVGSASAAAVLSDYRDLTVGGPITALVGPLGAAVAGLVFSRKGIHRVAYSPSQTGYDFFPISTSLGCPAANSVIAVRELCYFWSEDGVYVTDGGSVRPIGTKKVDRFIYENVDQTYMHRVYAAADPNAKIVYWAYPDSNASNGIPNNIIAYNYDLGRWSLPADNSGAYEFLLSSFSKGYTLDELTAFGTLETLPYSLDSFFWKGGRPLLGGFDSLHKYGAFSGANLAAVLETGELMDDGDWRALLRGVRPIVQPVNAGTAITLTTKARYREGPTDTLTDSTATAPNLNGVCPQLVSGRYMRARVDIAAAQDWKHAVGVVPNIARLGQR